MGLFDSINDNFGPGLIANFMSGGQVKASKDQQAGYARANQYFNPYYQTGQQQFNNLNDYANQQGQMFGGQGQYGNPMDWSWKHAGEDPGQFNNDIMSGYNQSQWAKNTQGQLDDATNRGASASGMLGSGAYMKALQGNANNINQADQQQYYNNVMGGYGQQQQAGQNYQNQQSKYTDLMKYLSDMGFDAAGKMAGNSISSSTAQAHGDEAKQDAYNQMISAAIQGFSRQ